MVIQEKNKWIVERQNGRPVQFVLVDRAEAKAHYIMLIDAALEFELSPAYIRLLWMDEYGVPTIIAETHVAQTM